MDEVNLLEDNLVDVVLDSAAGGVNTVEREGVSISHPAKFIMIGSGVLTTTSINLVYSGLVSCMFLFLSPCIISTLRFAVGVAAALLCGRAERLMCNSSRKVRR